MKYTMKGGPNDGTVVTVIECSYLIRFINPEGYYIRPPDSEEFESVSKQLAEEYSRMKADEQGRQGWGTLRWTHV